MNSDRILLVTIFLFCCQILLSSLASAENSSELTENIGEKSNTIANIAYFEAGPYWEFTLLHKEVTEALAKRGMLHRIHFDESLRLSPGWDAEPSIYRAAAKKLMTDPTVNLIISMGTVATKALLAENNDHTPIVSIDVADPVASGIINPNTGKGASNLTLLYIKDKWQQVFTLFHQALAFKRLGVMYHDSPEGRSYSNIQQAREVARELGFTLIEYSLLDQQESESTCAEGIQELIQKEIDAFYISALNCFDWSKSNPQSMLDSLHSRHILTLARDGTLHVQRGALMGLSTLDYKPLGDYYADQILRLLHFIPENTPIVQYIYHPKITLNLDTAKKLDLDTPLMILITVDELFDSYLPRIKNETADEQMYHH